ncbi:hypothetical protein [Atlantibacter hermannii]|uniref:hypothetical protein n=1 Tax=Atlantibacter hermannii TaxID=565 RepID=UPI00289D3CD3|nr:hypothetical protein [Atlantibacter hermannii]
MKTVAVLISIALLSGCAATPALKKQTASGKPEGIYSHTTTELVQSALVTRCNEKGFIVLESTASNVVCAKETQGGGAVMAQLLVGNAYSTTPQSKIRFSIGKVNDDVKVWADAWIESQMPGGQVNQMPVTSNDVRNSIQSGLDELKPQTVK